MVVSSGETEFGGKNYPGLGLGNIQGAAIKAKGHKLWKQGSDQQCQGAKIQENGGWFGVSHSSHRKAGMESWEMG